MSAHASSAQRDFSPRNCSTERKEYRFWRKILTKHSDVGWNNLPGDILHAFLDESGNAGLDFESEGVSTHFVVTAVLADGDKIEALDEQVEVVRKKHFQTGEMKSSNVGNNDARRLRILQDLRDLDFRIYAMVANKQAIWSEGLAIKQSFIKFMNGLVHRQLSRSFPLSNIGS